jgi:hypothetical protein
MDWTGWSEADCLGPDGSLSTGETDDAATTEQLTLEAA